MAAAVATHTLFVGPQTETRHDTRTQNRFDGSSDEVLAQAARAGDRAAFVVLIGRYERRIYRLAMRMLRNRSDAEEITQEAFLRAYRCIRFFKGEARFGTWLYRIALNEALMRQRARRRRPTDSLEDKVTRFADLGTAFCACADTDDLVDGKTLTQRVREALGRLDESHRAALVLRDLEELTAEQAGRILGISPEAVRQRSHRARVRLRELLADLADLVPECAHAARHTPGARSVPAARRAPARARGAQKLSNVCRASLSLAPVAT